MSVLDNLLLRGGTGGGLAVLIDPARTTSSAAAELARRSSDEGVAVLLIGDSFGSGGDISGLARAIKRAAPTIPLLQFPGTAAQLVPDVDAVLFLSLVSGRNPQYLIEEHVRAVPFVELNPDVEIISTAYCLVDGGCVTSVESVSQTRPLPADKPELVRAHVRAAMLIGMRTVYLDAGSGARIPVASGLVHAARAAAPSPSPLFVGGGVHGADGVRAARDAGADFVVVGTRFELSGPRAVRELALAARV
ncbi:MAG: geranylgeranylglyceryl/heptaprenylglyceryl phosphate synthase [Gemmatimonadaceae bacterium]